jgi:hypothetical protein
VDLLGASWCEEVDKKIVGKQNWFGGLLQDMAFKEFGRDIWFTWKGHSDGVLIIFDTYPVSIGANNKFPPSSYFLLDAP